MRGSIVKRGKGYSVVVELDRDPDTGKRRQRWHSGYRTKRDAERALAELAGSVHTGSYVPRTRATVADLAAEWLDAIRPTIRPSTHASYSRNLRLHVLPHIGGTPTTRVDGRHPQCDVRRARGRGEAGTVRTVAGRAVPADGPLRAHNLSPHVP
ncbi:MAG: Arm DNA-binding domain-containing protein [Mycobacteriales bacterium]